MVNTQIKTWSTPVAMEEKRLIPCNLCGSSLFKPYFSCEGFSYVRCSACALVQINPQPLEAEVKRRYDMSYGKDYLTYELTNENAFLNLELLALADTNFNKLEPGLILDIGCATGYLLEKLRDNGWETVGVEISGPQLNTEEKSETWIYEAFLWKKILFRVITLTSFMPPILLSM
jgi:SAM-dependent methyltransferase